MKTLQLYPITIEQCEEGGYFATCDVLQGCHAEGETYADVISNVQSVIEEHIKLRQQHGEIVPQVTLSDSQSWQVTLPLPIQHG